MHIFVKCHLLDSFDALPTNMQNFSRNVGTERRQEISRTGREILVLSEHNLNIPLRRPLLPFSPVLRDKLRHVFQFSVILG